MCVQGLGEKCPYYLDPAKNDLTGRRILTSQVKELIVQLHNEVSSRAISRLRGNRCNIEKMRTPHEVISPEGAKPCRLL